MGKCTPAAYSTVNNDRYRFKKANGIEFSRLKEKRFKPGVFEDKSKPAPGSYQPLKAEPVIRPKMAVYTVSKEKGGNFFSKTSKDRKWVPGPGSYKIDKADKFITIGARRSYK